MQSESVLIIGGGVAGLAAASTLAERNIEVSVIEKEAWVGGKAVTYGCKAADECTRCGVCLALDCVDEFQNSGASFLPNTEVEVLRGKPGSFEATAVTRERINNQLCIDCGRCQKKCPESAISSNYRARNIYTLEYERCRLESGETCEICREVCPVDAVDPSGEPVRRKIEAGAVILATGFEPFPAETLGHYRCGEPGVVSAFDLEQKLSSGSPEGILGANSKVAFLQCVGSRDEQLKNTYCSRVCCAYALRMARSLKEELPESEVTLFYMDLQTFGKNWTAFRDEILEAGVELIRGKPAEIRSTQDGVDVVYEEQGSGTKRRYPADLAVLSVGITPGKDTSSLGRILGLNRDRYGFFGPAGVGENDSGRPGIFLAGTCEGPRDIAESAAHGRRAALQAISLLRGRSAWKTG